MDKTGTPDPEIAFIVAADEYAVIADVHYQNHYMVVAPSTDDNGAGDDGTVTLHVLLVEAFGTHPDGPVTRRYMLLGVADPAPDQLGKALNLVADHERWYARVEFGV